MPHETDSDHFDLVCHRCGVQLSPGSGNLYVVRIEAFADPTPPTAADVEALGDITKEINDLLEQMRDIPEQELMDQVHRRLTIFLCWPCYRRWIEDPAA